MFCARCGQQIDDAPEICPLCGKQATITLDPPRVEKRPFDVPLPATAQTPETTNTFASYAPAALTGVGGWLLIFVAGLTIIGPLLTVRDYVENPDRIRSGGILDLALEAYGMVVGIFLWQPDARGLNLLKIYFGLVAAIAVLGLARIALLPTGTLQSFAPVFVLLRSLIYVAIWVMYFRNSVRVHATYGRNL